VTRRYALYGEASQSALTFNGKVLVHNDRAELELLFPGVRVVELGSMIPEHDTMQVRDHPSLGAVKWPLNREDFKLWDTGSPPPSGPTSKVKSGMLSTWTSNVKG
jgi:hypothetical protein